jgi:hypothetical protein
VGRLGHARIIPPVFDCRREGAGNSYLTRATVKPS